MRHADTPPRLLQGFSLMELMITVGIVSMLAAVAYPAYTSQIRKGNRAECRAGLFQAMQQQERYYTQYNAYAVIAEPGANSPIKNFSGDNVAGSACYISTVASAPVAACTGPSCVALQARQVRTTNDPVSTLTLDSLGNKGCTYNGTLYPVAAGTAAKNDCWP